MSWSVPLDFQIHKNGPIIANSPHPVQKPLFLSILCFAALVPFTPAEAAGPAGKAFGPFSPRKTFKLKITRVDTSRQILTPYKLTTGVRIPDGVPKYEVGQKVEFTIGANGQLKVRGLSIPFAGQTISYISYNVLPTVSKPSPRSALILKDAAGKPKAGGNLAFRTYKKVNKPDMVTTTVTYVF